MGRAFFNYITTGAFTPVGPLLAPVVNPDIQMNWALLIISKTLTLLKKLHLPAFSYPLTFSTFPFIKVSTGRGGAKRGLWVWNTPNRQVVGKLFNPSWMKRNTN
jgi:hypothetical protein